ncbi:flagellar basal body rod protein FlgG [candidate division LCP-89 bacterium B3_LCP]|uniref:Flagellar basal-body rod protein FlgG n=1 Tax=candidate division LCP-89 bacterium B3_LCP TaxID=2012998 RepID=A0A532UZB6_UNCL8|nr:MAG: flagellar basal body rod protein FlgG [candidate division LCP-89 bacterium B3_LCP]
MIRSLRSAASGMFAQQLRLDNIANNLANVNTTGFKKSDVQFQDLMYQVIRPASASLQSNVIEPVELAVGHGVRPVANTRSYAQGTLTGTGNPLDLAISGDGFFQVQMPDGQIAYTRDGQMKINADGVIVTANGYYVEPDINLPDDTQQIAINREGIVMAYVAGKTLPEEIGQLELARFINPAGMTSLGQNLFAETIASGPPIRGEASLDGFGSIEQGYLEASNVSVVEEMVEMITTQRAYEINSKSIKTADQMLQHAANLKR